MLQIQKDASFAKRGLLFGIVEVVFPQPSEWNEDAFAALKERELAALFAEFREYDRKAVFGENPYYRYFKKYKKTYPVLLRNSRYNQHATAGSLLVEVGSAGNSPEEAVLAGRLFAERMAEVLNAQTN